MTNPIHPPINQTIITSQNAGPQESLKNMTQNCQKLAQSIEKQQQQIKEFCKQPNLTSLDRIEVLGDKMQESLSKQIDLIATLRASMSASETQPPREENNPLHLLAEVSLKMEPFPKAKPLRREALATKRKTLPKSSESNKAKKISKNGIKKPTEKPLARPSKRLKKDHLTHKEVIAAVALKIKQSKFKEAENILKEQLEKTDLSPEARAYFQLEYAILLNGHGEKEKFEKAKKVLDETNKEHLGNVADYYFQKSYTYSELGEHNEAKTLAKKGIKKLTEKEYSHYPLLFNQLARSYFELGHYNKAIKAAKKGLASKLSVESSEPYLWLEYNLVRSHLGLKRYEKTIFLAQQKKIAISPALSSLKGKKTFLTPLEKAFIEKFDLLIKQAEKAKAEQ